MRLLKLSFAPSTYTKHRLRERLPLAPQPCWRIFHTPIRLQGAPNSEIKATYSTMGRSRIQIAAWGVPSASCGSGSGSEEIAAGSGSRSDIQRT
mmetsp:Transcript_28295/g.64021  ORF Transcript_28295/g.64021 Transcript_28295/m.64021 type:complete len:94 (-) Transcript_28295:531-812(-)